MACCQMFRLLMVRTAPIGRRTRAATGRCCRDGSDADHRCVPLGLGYFVENKCYETWNLFFDFVKDGLTFDTAQFPNAVSLDVLDNITIADCDKGLLSAYKKVFKRARIFHCADHR